MGGERQWGEESRRERRLGRHHRHHPLGHRPLDVDERVEGVGIRLRWAPSRGGVFFTSRVSRGWCRKCVGEFRECREGEEAEHTPPWRG